MENAQGSKAPGLSPAGARPIVRGPCRIPSDPPRTQGRADAATCRGRTMIATWHGRLRWAATLAAAAAVEAVRVCCRRALPLGAVSQVAPVDSLCVVQVALFALSYPSERPAARGWPGVARVGAGVVVLARRR
jgi:hypothetical protein